jgi:broad specificity phosphatase PhoE
LTGRGEEAGLTAEGRGEAERAAEVLRAVPVSAVYASPRQRTIDTARAIARPHGLPVRLAAELDEIDFGRWTGMTFAELDGQAEWDRWNTQRSEARCPGGESMAQAQARAVSFAFEVAARHDGTVVLVTHCDIIRALLCWQERRSLDDILSFEAGPASVTQLSLVAAELESA